MSAALLLTLAAAALPPATVRADLEVAERTLDAAYPRVLVPDDAWRSARRALRGVAGAGPMTADRFCRVLGSRLASVRDVRVFAPGGKTPCLDVELGVPGHAVAYASRSSGPNLAGARPFALEHRRGPSGEVAVLAVSTFGPDGASPAALAPALAKARAADAIILDLRGASGHRTALVRPLVEAFTDRPADGLLQSILRADTPEVRALRRPHAARHRDPEAWRRLVGPRPDAPPTPLTARRPARTVTVLIGPGCGASCQLVARALERDAAATVRGQLPRWAPNLVAGERVRRVLPGTRVELELPTAAYVLAKAIAPRPDLSVGWHRPGPPPGRRGDVLPYALRTTFDTLTRYRRIDRWRDAEPPPCAGLPTAERWRSLPREVQDRISGVSVGPSRIITAHLYLPRARARAFVAGCPGVEITSTGVERDEITTLSLRAKRWSDLARLAHSEAVQLVSIEFDRPHQPH